MHKYSETTDSIYPVAILGRYKDLPDDLIDITEDEARVHMGVTPPPGGKRRKPNAHPFVWEDLPPPSVAQLQAAAKQTRDDAIESNIVLTGTSAEYQIDAAARANIAAALRKAEANGCPDTEVRDWRLADNSWRETTLGELKQLLNQYDERFESVWYQFNIWDSGDRSQPFEVEV